MTGSEPQFTKYTDAPIEVLGKTIPMYEIETPDDPGEPFFYITIGQVDSLIELLQRIKAEHSE